MHEMNVNAKTVWANLSFSFWAERLADKAPALLIASLLRYRAFCSSAAKGDRERKIHGRVLGTSGKRGAHTVCWSLSNVHCLFGGLKWGRQGGWWWWWWWSVGMSQSGAVSSGIHSSVQWRRSSTSLPERHNVLQSTRTLLCRWHCNNVIHCATVLDMRCTLNIQPTSVTCGKVLHSVSQSWTPQ